MIFSRLCGTPIQTINNGIAVLTFHSEHSVTSYSGPHYQPNFSDGKKMYDYGNVVCKKQINHNNKSLLTWRQRFI